MLRSHRLHALRSSSRPVALAALALVTLSLTACGGSNYRFRPTPDLKTPGQTRAERSNTVFLGWNTDLRAIHEDVARLLLTDKPSALQKRNLPY